MMAMGSAVKLQMKMLAASIGAGGEGGSVSMVLPLSKELNDLISTLSVLIKKRCVSCC